LSASHDAQRNQATITSLQSKIAQQPGSLSPTFVTDRSLSPSPNGLRLEGEGGDAGREREAELLAQLHSAQQELTSLRAQLSGKKDSVLEQSGDVENMRFELERMGTQLAQKQAEMDATHEQLSSELEALRRQLAQSAENEMKLERELDEVKATLAEGDNNHDRVELEQLREQLNHAQQVIAELHKEADESLHKQAEINTLHAQLHQAQGNLAKVTLDHHHTGVADGDKYKSEIDALHMNVENMREQLQQSQDKIERETNMNSKLVRELEIERENLEKEINTNTALTNELAQVSSQLLESESRVTNMGAQLKKSFERLAEEHDRERARHAEETQNEMDAIRTKLRESESHSATLREQLRETLDNLEREKHANSELVQELANQGTKPTVDSDQTKHVEIESLRTQTRDLEQDMREQVKAAQEHMQQLVYAKDQLAENQRKFGHTQAELDSLRTQFLNATTANIQLEGQLKELRAKAKQADEREEDSLLMQLQQTREDLEKATDANTELERQLQETLDELEQARSANTDKHSHEDSKLAHAIRELEKQVEEDKAKLRRKDSELEDLRAQLRESESHANTLLAQCQLAREHLEKISTSNMELEKQCNQKQVELNTLRAQMLANERNMELLRVELLQARDSVENEKHAKLELERELEEERMKPSIGLSDERQEELDRLNVQLQQANENLDTEMQTHVEQRQVEHDKLKKAWEELDKKERTNVDLERQLALMRAEEGMLRAQLQQQKGDLDNLRAELRDVQMEKDTEEQERVGLASMIEALQQANESLAVQLHKRESPRPNGKSEIAVSPKKSTPKKEPKSSEEKDDPEELQEEIVEDEEEEEFIEDDEDDDDDDDKEELVEALQEEIKHEQKRTTNLVQAIYTLQIELQQDKTKQSEMDRSLEDLQRGNDRLTQEVYDLRNAWTETKNEPKEEGKGRTVVAKDSEGENAHWGGLEKEVSNAVGLRAVALRTIIQGILLLFTYSILVPNCTTL
jgi:chromosome segregation ATPase